MGPRIAPARRLEEPKRVAPASGEKSDRSSVSLMEEGRSLCILTKSVSLRVVVNPARMDTNSCCAARLSFAEGMRGKKTKSEEREGSSAKKLAVLTVVFFYLIFLDWVFAVIAGEAERNGDERSLHAGILLAHKGFKLKIGSHAPWCEVPESAYPS